MHLQVESFGEVNVVRVKKERLIYPDLRTFSAESLSLSVSINPKPLSVSRLMVPSAICPIPQTSSPAVPRYTENRSFSHGSSSVLVLFPGVAVEAIAELVEEAAE